MQRCGLLNLWFAYEVDWYNVDVKRDTVRFRFRLEWLSAWDVGAPLS